MKPTSFMLGAIGAMAGFIASSPALADNAMVENALRNRPDLSNFYQALVDSGVNQELQPGASYSVFAPTNDAFARITPAQYPCFYEATCRAEIADILRNHIVPGEVHVSDAAKQRGGIYSIDNRFIPVGEPVRNNFTVDGQNITSMNQLAGGMLYKIDGVIANGRELAGFQYGEAEYAYIPAEQVTTTTERSYYNPSCRTGYCPDARVETTTVRTAPVLVPAPLMSPAR